MKAAVSGPAIRPTMYNGIWRHLRFPEGEPSIDDWTVHGGRLQRVQTRRMHGAACHRFIQGLLSRAISNWRSCVEANGVSRRVEMYWWLRQSWALVLLVGPIVSLRFCKPPLLPGP